MTLDWATLDRCASRRNLRGITDLLLAATEDERLGFAKELETRVRAVPEERFWTQNNPARGYALAAIGCLPTAARTAALLGRRNIRDSWGDVPTDLFLELARARELSWIGDLGVRLAGSISARDPWRREWSLASALLGAADLAPPVTEGVVRSWLREMHGTLGDQPAVALVQQLRDSPYLDLLLPAVFDMDGVGSELTSGWSDGQGGWDPTPRWPAAVAELVTEGRLGRRTIIDATVDRLVRGDRPAWLRPFALLHDALAPTVDEMVEHAPAYARLLSDAPSAVAGLAQRALRGVDDAGKLEFEALMEASQATLVRPEKGLVKAQLSWLEKVVRREPDRAGEVLVTVAVAFDHPALEVQDRALSLVSRRVRDVDAVTVTLLAEAARGLAGDLPGRAEALFGTAVQATGPSNAGLPALPRLPASAELPPPISGAAELAEEVVALLHDETAVRWERVLAGIVATRGTVDTTALAATLGPVLDRYWAHVHHHGWSERSRIELLGDALRVLVMPTVDRGRRARQRMGALLRAVTPGIGGVHGSRQADSPPDVLALRLIEISDRSATSPVPALLSTPTSVTGSLDADVLLGRLRSAEEDGWQPWPMDLEQALLRVPREVDGDLRARAEGLRSPAGREFARWLATGGMPDPVSTRCEQVVKPDDDWGYVSSRPEVRRVVVSLTPARAGKVRLQGTLGTLRPPTTLSYHPYATTPVTDQLAMVLPHHREVVAAWALPYLACLADSDARGGASLLPLLAECSGPLGPAMSLSLAYALGARHESDRVAGVDAFLALAAGEEPFAAALGADLGHLCSDGTVKLSRVVPALAEAHRAGAAVAVWESSRAALPLLLPAAPRGLNDLLELATRAAGAVGATDDIPELAAVAGRTSGSRLVTEARRLQTVLRG